MFDRSNTSLQSFIFVCSQEVRPETVFKKKKKKLCQFVFVVVQTEFDRSNTSLKSFIFVCSQEVRPETVFYLNL